jgi:hypothetical protein
LKGYLVVLLPGVLLLSGVVGLVLPGALLSGAVVLPAAVSLVLGGVVPPVAPVVLSVAPLAAPDAVPKWASHSAREICPSPSLSTSVKLGTVMLVAPVELPVALGGDDSVLPEAPVADEPVCAMDTPAIARRAAAVAVPTNLSIWTFLLHIGLS